MLAEKIGVIGAGKIGSAILRGVIRAGLIPKEKIIASDVSDVLRHSVAKELGIKVTADNGTVCDFADIVILAVKPQVVDSVIKKIAKRLAKNKLLVSVAAGVPVSRIEANLTRGAHVVRVMPNIPCVVGAGASCYAAGTHASATDAEKVALILNSFGIALAVEEKYLDAVTGLSGSGPAYVFVLIDALADGGVQVGLSREVALKLARHRKNVTLGGAHSPPGPSTRPTEDAPARVGTDALYQTADHPETAEQRPSDDDDKYRRKDKHSLKTDALEPRPVKPLAYNHYY